MKDYPLTSDIFFKNLENWFAEKEVLNNQRAILNEGLETIINQGCEIFNLNKKEMKEFIKLFNITTHDFEGHKYTLAKVFKIFEQEYLNKFVTHND